MSSGKLTDKNTPLKKRVIMVKGNRNMVREGKNKLQTQNDYKCDLCEETFSQKIKLQKHLKLCLKYLEKSHILLHMCAQRVLSYRLI